MGRNLMHTAAAAALIALVSGCGLTTKSGTMKAVLGGGSLLDPGASRPDYNGTAAVKDYLQIRESMAAVTGVDPVATTAINTFYNGAKSRLSSDGSASALSPATLLTSVSLAGLFCQSLVSSAVNPGGSAPNANASRIFAGVDFTKVPQTAASATVRQNVINQLSQSFLGRAPAAAESATLLQAMTDMETGLTTGGTRPRAASVADTASVMLGACTAVLGSLEFIAN
jgi:hypothetical protein